jgi:hypothetical protein
VHGIHYGTLLFASRHVGLVGYDKQKKALTCELRERLLDVVQHLEFINRVGWVRLAIAEHNPIEYPVAIKKNGAPGRLMAHSDSHFVSACFSSG